MKLLSFLVIAPVLLASIQILISLNIPEYELLTTDSIDVKAVKQEQLEKKNLETKQISNFKIEAEVKQRVLPAFYELAVPFSSQAPYANWENPWQEACEETGVIMAYHYFNGSSLTPELARKDILRLVEYQNKQYGFYFDTNVDLTAQMARDVHHLNTEIIKNPTTQDIKRFIFEGKVVLAPVAGRLLNNIYFTPPGPLYHMLVIKGFDDKTQEFITNDPGTKQGEGLRYSYSTIIRAIRDYTGEPQTILQGKQRVLVIKGIKDEHYNG